MSVSVLCTSDDTVNISTFLCMLSPVTLLFLLVLADLPITAVESVSILAAAVLLAVTHRFCLSSSISVCINASETWTSASCSVSRVIAVCSLPLCLLNTVQQSVQTHPIRSVTSGNTSKMSLGSPQHSLWHERLQISHFMLSSMGSRQTMQQLSSGSESADVSVPLFIGPVCLICLPSSAHLTSVTDLPLLWDLRAFI